jgi:hypothetical protein
MRSVITPHWQYITNEELDEELYDWKQDPEELHNLATTPEGQQLDRELLVRLRALVGESSGKRAVSKQYRTGEPERAGPSLTPASPQLH